MTIFEKFSEQMPSNEKITAVVLEEVAGDSVSPETLKKSFSGLVSKIHDKVYATYLKHEEAAGNLFINEYLKSIPSSPFNDLNSFFLSVSQSRRVRAGKSFETVIRTLFRKLNYPFDEQIIINGKPDFLLPSAEHYHEDPMDCIIFTAKRTLRERWRQIVTEGTKGYGFFLATLDEDITEPQIAEMKYNRIYVVVPKEVKISNPVYSSAHNIISFETLFKDYLDPAVTRWKDKGLIDSQ